MTTLLLIRHGDTDAVGRVLAGSAPGWHLNSHGRQQVERLADRLANVPIKAVYTSPVERAVETAEPIAQRHGLELQRTDALEEVRMGEWEGLTFAELEHLEERRRFNAFRSGVRAPGGELMLETQVRMIQQFHCIQVRHPHDTVAVVSHADPLRAAIAYFLGIPLDLMLRFEISPASLSVVQMGEWAARVICLNDTGEVPA